MAVFVGVFVGVGVAVGRGVFVGVGVAVGRGVFVGVGVAVGVGSGHMYSNVSGSNSHSSFDCASPEFEPIRAKTAQMRTRRR